LRRQQLPSPESLIASLKHALQAYTSPDDPVFCRTYYAQFCTGSTPEQSGRSEAPHEGDEGGEAAHPGAPAWGHGIEGVEVGCGRLLMLVMLGLLPGLEMVC
jgi:hypothetical protein